MSDSLRASRYRQLIRRLGDAAARAVIDDLQVLALTAPDTLRELEVFIGRNEEPDKPGLPGGGTPTKDTSERNPPQRS